MSCFIYANEEESNQKVNIDELYNKNHARDIKQLSVFKKILARVHNKIKIASKTKTNDHCVWFTVPEFIFGDILYDSGHCTAYLINELEENGFFVQFVNPNILFISWHNHVPTYVRNNIKKRTGVEVDDRGNVKQDDVPVDETPKEDPKKEDSKHVSTKQYKPSGKFMYNRDLFDNIDKRINYGK